MVAASAQRGAMRLGRLVDDLLVLAQLQSRSLRVDRASLDVAATVREAVHEAASSRTTDVELAVDVTPGPPIHGDHLRVTQIVSNLLGNALKFARSRVRCSARFEGDRWVVEVTDDGPGVPEEDLDRIFEPFFRARASAGGQQPGAGLGLAISAQLAERLGGSIRLENRPEGGACARLVLPVEPPTVETRRVHDRSGAADRARRRRRRGPARGAAAHARARRAGSRAAPGRALGPAGPARAAPRRPSCSTSGCRISTAGRCWSASATSATSRCCCSQRATWSSTRSAGSRPAPTTTSPSRSATPSWSRGCRPCSAGQRRRRRQGRRSARDEHSGVRMELRTRRVLVGGETVDVSPLEWRLLLALEAALAARCSPPSSCSSSAWNDPVGVSPERVKFAVLRLRRKLGPGRPAHRERARLRLPHLTAGSPPPFGNRAAPAPAPRGAPSGRPPTTRKDLHGEDRRIHRPVARGRRQGARGARGRP